jgi:hypothetical protein
MKYSKRSIDQGRRDALKKTASVGLAAAAAMRGVPLYAQTGGSATLPSWVPAPGKIVDASLDTLARHAPEVPRYPMRSIYDAWSGISYFPWWGPFGTFVATGGGHNDSAYNDIFAYSVEERTHRRIKKHAPIIEHADHSVADDVTGWMWADTFSNDLRVGESFAGHMYASGVAIPPGVIDGDAPNGWLFTPGKVAIPYAGALGTRQPHRIAVGVAEKWEAHGTPMSRSISHAPALYDSKRKRVVTFPDNFSKTLLAVDALTEENGSLTLDANSFGHYHTAFYDAARDLYLSIAFTPATTSTAAKVRLEIVDPNTNKLLLASIQGTLPNASYVGGWDWVPEWSAFVFYPGRGNDVWMLVSTQDDLRGPYRFEKQTLAGTVRIPSSGNPHYNRFRYVAQLGCFLWFPSVELPVQAFGVRPPGLRAATPVGARIASLTITSELLAANVPFTVGQAFKKGEVFDSVAIDGIPSQCNVLNRWGDGSIKFASLTGIASFSGPRTFELRQASAPQPRAPIPLPSLPMRIEAAGVVIQLQQVQGKKLRLTGSEMSEYTATHRINAHMVALFCIRVYRSGDVWVRWTVHNGHLRVAGAKNFVYRLKIVAGSATVIDQNVDHKSHTQITGRVWLTRVCKTAPKHDLAYLASTRLVPNYGWRSPSSSAFGNLVQAATPMGRGNLRANFSDPGYHDQIGLLPRWDALYLTSGDVRAFRAVIANADMGASFSVHYLDEATLRPLKFSDHPTLSVSDSVMAFSGGRVYNHDMAHQPSIGYLAYLLTADSYYLEEVQHWATWNHLSIHTTLREGRSGILRGQPRSVAWGWRTLATAATITPDGDPLAADYAYAWGANMKRYYDRYVAGTAAAETGGPNVLGVFALYSGNASGDAYGPNNGVWEDSPWMQHFLQQSLGFSSQLEIPLQTAEQRSAHNNLRDFAFQHAVGVLGEAGAGRPYQYASDYIFPYGTTATLDEKRSPIVHYPSWAAQWQAHKAMTNRGDPAGSNLLGSSGGNPASMATGYWGNLHPAIALAVDAGVPGAEEAYARMTGAPNYASGAATFHNTPQFGIVPR